MGVCGLSWSRRGKPRCRPRLSPRPPRPPRHRSGKAPKRARPHGKPSRSPWARFLSLSPRNRTIRPQAVTRLPGGERRWELHGARSGCSATLPSSPCSSGVDSSGSAGRPKRSRDLGRFRAEKGLRVRRDFGSASHALKERVRTYPFLEGVLRPRDKEVVKGRERAAIVLPKGARRREP